MQTRYLVHTFWPLLLLAGGVGAQQSGNLADHALFTGFPESEISELETIENTNYRVVLGSLQSARGQVAPEASERVRGKLTRILYQVPNSYSGQDVYDFFVEQMRLRGYRELFTCAGRACGSSEYWANDIFGSRILYGPVRNQFYLAMGSDPAGLFYISAYVITRINRQLLAYLEIIEPVAAAAVPTQADPAFMLQQLREFGGIVLQELAFEADDRLAAGADLEEVAELMRLDPDLHLYLVAHLQGEGDLEELLVRSESRAEAVRQALLGQGIDAVRLTARGLGPLAPLCVGGNCAERVELVLRSAQQ